MYADNVSNKEIFEVLGINRITVKNVIDKCRQVGPIVAIDGMARPEKSSVIVMMISHTSPSLHATNRKNSAFRGAMIDYCFSEVHQGRCVGDGYPNLAGLSRLRLWEFLEERELKPYRITYYLKRKDPEFKEKTGRLLILYKAAQAPSTVGS